MNQYKLGVIKWASAAVTLRAHCMNVYLKKYCTHTNRVIIKPCLLYGLWAEVPSFKRKSLKVVVFWLELTTAYEDTLCYKDIFELSARISLICSFFCALITCVYCIKDQ
jgi:hypothetical protein